VFIAHPSLQTDLNGELSAERMTTKRRMTIAAAAPDSPNIHLRLSPPGPDPGVRVLPAEPDGMLSTGPCGIATPSSVFPAVAGGSWDAALGSAEALFGCARLTGYTPTPDVRC
jgi:hypothetical protein